MGTKSWSEQSRTRQVLTVALSIVQIGLAVAAWADLARRPAVQVRGSKRTWAGVIAINFVGPLLYFSRGRRTS